MAITTLYNLIKNVGRFILTRRNYYQLLCETVTHATGRRTGPANTQRKEYNYWRM